MRAQRNPSTKTRRKAGKAIGLRQFALEVVLGRIPLGNFGAQQGLLRNSSKIHRLANSRHIIGRGRAVPVYKQSPKSYSASRLDIWASDASHRCDGYSNDRWPRSWLFVVYFQMRPVTSCRAAIWRGAVLTIVPAQIRLNLR